MSHESASGEEMLASNNINIDFDEEFRAAGEAAEEFVPSGVITMCYALPIIESDTTGRKPQNDEMAILMEVDREAKNGHMTLNSINAGPDDDEMELVKEYFDLDKPAPEFHQPPEEHHHYQNQLQTEFQDYSSELDYNHQYDPLNSSGQLLPPFDTCNPNSAPISPDSTLDNQFSECCISNNSNDEERPVRSRKMSSRSEKICLKVIEKPYRTRATKADMESMTAKEKSERKKAQNKLNAKKCVARKNEAKKQFGDLTVQNQGEYEEAQQRNNEMKNRLLDTYGKLIYPNYFDNNSPFGIPEEFEKILEARMEIAIKTSKLEEARLDVEEREKKFIEDNQRFEDVLNEDKSKYKPATYASKKSRAKSDKELSENRFHSALFIWKLDKQVAMEEEMEAIAMELNPYLEHMGCKPFVVKYKAPS